MSYLMADTILGLVLICFYLLLDQCGYMLARRKRGRTFPEKADDQINLAESAVKE